LAGTLAFRSLSLTLNVRSPHETMSGKEPARINDDASAAVESDLRRATTSEGSVGMGPRTAARGCHSFRASDSCALAGKNERLAVVSNTGRAFWANERPELRNVITATRTWTDIRNFEENASGCQRAQLAWALVLAVSLVLVVALVG
jgi:hypothetical protein